MLGLDPRGTGPSPAPTSDPTRAGRPRSGPRRAFVALGLVLILAGLVNLAAGERLSAVGSSAPFDFDLNWVAARRLVDGEPIYDRAASRADAVRDVGTWMQRSNDSPFHSYIGPPSTALIHVPFLAVEHDRAVSLFRLAIFWGMVGALVLTSRALSAPSQLPAALIGVGALLLSFPLISSLALGQGNEFVMLGLALGVWAASRERWGLAGIGLGIATVLKVSPGLLVLYLLLRGKRRAVWAAAATVIGFVAVAAAVGRTEDLGVWLRHVTPEVSEGTLDIGNQSLVGLLARLATTRHDFVNPTGLGGWHLVGYAIALGGALLLWRARKNRPFDVLELGVLILVVLLAGPLSWDHYATWALVALVLVADPCRWSGRSPAPRAAMLLALGVATALCSIRLRAPTAAAVAANWSVRIASSPYTVALVLYLAVAWWLLPSSEEPARPVEPAPSRPGTRDVTY